MSSGLPPKAVVFRAGRHFGFVCHQRKLVIRTNDLTDRAVYLLLGNQPRSQPMGMFKEGFPSRQAAQWAGRRAL